MDSIIQWIYLFTAVSFIPGIVTAYLFYKKVSKEHHVAAIGLITIPGFASFSYLLMTFNIGTIDLSTIEIVGSNITFVSVRYIDWLVTTPILVGLVAYVSQAPKEQIVKVMCADGLMIITGAGAVIADGMLQWGLFIISGGFHIILFVYLYAVLPKYPTDPQSTGFFHLLKHHIGLLWLAYPIVWVLAPTGIEYTSFLGASIMYAFLDAIAKIPYVFFFYSRIDNFQGDMIGSTQSSNIHPSANDD